MRVSGWMVAVVCQVGCAEQLTIHTTPAGAYVYKNEKLVGRTPVSMTIARSEVPTRFDLYAPGFDARSLYLLYSGRSLVGWTWSTAEFGAPAGAFQSSAIDVRLHPELPLAPKAVPADPTAMRWTITTAIEAAQRGDCSTVRRLAGERSQDDDLRRLILEREASISGCLKQADDKPVQP